MNFRSRKEKIGFNLQIFKDVRGLDVLHGYLGRFSSALHAMLLITVNAGHAIIFAVFVIRRR
jgi:hypothetical protein